MTVTATFDINDEMLIRYALGLAVQKCIGDKERADSRHDVTSAYKAEQTAEAFRNIERQLHALEVEGLRKIKREKAGA